MLTGESVLRINSQAPRLFECRNMPALAENKRQLSNNGAAPPSQLEECGRWLRLRLL